MTLEDYRKLLDDVRKAQGALNHEVAKDLQRLAGAESNGTKAKIAEAYERGLNDAWAVCKDLSFGELNEYAARDLVFGTMHLREIYFEIGAKSAVQKYMEYKAKEEEAEKSELRVGDEVQRTNNPSVKVIVTETDSEKWAGFNSAGSVGIGSVKEFSECWEKTGRHFDQIENILEEMKK